MSLADTTSIKPLTVHIAGMFLLFCTRPIRMFQHSMLVIQQLSLVLGDCVPGCKSNKLLMVLLMLDADHTHCQ